MSTIERGMLAALLIAAAVVGVIGVLYWSELAQHRSEEAAQTREIEVLHRRLADKQIELDAQVQASQHAAIQVRILEADKAELTKTVNRLRRDYANAIQVSAKVPAFERGRRFDE